MPDWTELLLVLLDTNVLISSFFSPGGNEARLIALLSQRKLSIAYTTQILEEYDRVLSRPKFGFQAIKTKELLNLIIRDGHLCYPARRLKISPHEPDNRFLECAEAAEANYLITGNLRHFPSAHGSTRIVNARTFLEEFDRLAIP